MLVSVTVRLFPICKHWREERIVLRAGDCGREFPEELFKSRKLHHFFYMSQMETGLVQISKKRSLPCIGGDVRHLTTSHIVTGDKLVLMVVMRCQVVIKSRRMNLFPFPRVCGQASSSKNDP